MKNQFLRLASAVFPICILVLATHTQSTLPPCLANAGYRHNCRTSSPSPTGTATKTKFLGRRHGKGTLYDADGKAGQTGYWRRDLFVGEESPKGLKSP